MLSRLGLAFCLFAVSMAPVHLASQTSVPPGPPTASTPSASTADAPHSDLVAPLMAGEIYRLGVGDTITVTFFNESDLNRECYIRGDGSIFLAMLREPIKAAGKTPEDLQHEIEDAYRNQKLYKNPMVTVSVKEFRSSPVTITGYVVKPVTIQVQGRTTLTTALAMAGGLSQQAGTKIHVSHPERTDAAGITVPAPSETISYHDLLEHPDNKEINVTLHGGDVVTVQRTDYVYVGGAVNKPGMLALNEVDSWTVLKALAACGNLSRVAKKDATVIVRKKEDGTTDQIPLDLAKILHREAPDVVLRANDIILVPESAGLKALYAAAQTLNGMSSGVVTGLTLH